MNCCITGLLNPDPNEVNKYNQNEKTEEVNIAFELLNFAKEGLRTLVVA